jgi:S1-C subfamily serine protease
MRNTDRSDPTGIRVTSVTERSPAWFAGLREGDLVYRATGKNVKKLSDFDTIMQNQSVGDQFLVFVERDSQRWSILMKVGARPL